MDVKKANSLDSENSSTSFHFSPVYWECRYAGLLAAHPATEHLSFVEVPKAGVLCTGLVDLGRGLVILWREPLEFVGKTPGHMCGCAARRVGHIDLALLLALFLWMEGEKEGTPAPCESPVREWTRGSWLVHHPHANNSVRHVVVAFNTNLTFTLDFPPP